MSEVGRERLVLGELVARMDGTDLREITWQGADVANRIYAAVRDDQWGTVPGTIRELSVEPWGRGAEIHFEQDHSPAGAPVVLRGNYRLTPDHIVASLEGRWSGDFATNRTGWCLLHPLSHVGGRVDSSLGHGPGVGRPIPELVIPQELDPAGFSRPAWGPFDQLGITAGGIHIDHHFEGELFETEDQRNWSDASFKTYGTPSSEPQPRLVHAGEEFFQRITIRFEHAASGHHEQRRAQVHNPQMQTLALLDDVVADAELEPALRIVDGVRARIRASEPERARAIMRQAATAPVWDLEVLAGPGTDWAAVRDALPATSPARVVVLPDGAPPGSPETTPPEWVVAARNGLGGLAPVGGGTLHNLAELQRHPLAAFDVVSFTYSPRVHADDATSIEETPQAYPAMVATVRARSEGAVVSVGPLRDPDALPTGWVGRSLDGWRAAGADVVCIAPVRDVVRLLGS